MLASVTLFAAGGGAQAQSKTSAEIAVRADQPGAKINRQIYGQFAEHLGRGIYEGIWVGEDSKIPNTRGYRNDVVKALQELKIPVVRWPGGCFADEYHWREGIGPRNQRPIKVNTHWGGVEEPNSFGTHEFLDFAELIGAEAYVSGNAGSGSAQEMADWVEYITSDSKSSLAEQRRKNGREKPWKLPYFGVGNETWGCGGNMRAEYWADEFRRYQTFVKAPKDNHPVKVASGANGDDYLWTEVMLSQAAKFMDAYSIHHYTRPRQVKWEDKGAATGFPESEWASTLKNTLFMDELVTKHSAIMDKYDPDKRIALYVDEWGTWYDPTPGQNPGFLWQQNTLRDALVASLTFNILHRHADRVRMGNIAQMVNVLQAMILTEQEKMLLTPTYYAFQMYIPFQDATSLPVSITTPEYKFGVLAMPAVDASAARGADGRVHLALLNLDPNKPASVSVKIAGVNGRAATGRVLTGKAMDARNTFEQPNAMQPVAFKGTRKGDQLVFELPPKSLAVVSVE
jgi:alpha-N-arabinofuranosidase